MDSEQMMAHIRSRRVLEREFYSPVLAPRILLSMVDETEISIVYYLELEILGETRGILARDYETRP